MHRAVFGLALFINREDGVLATRRDNPDTMKTMTAPHAPTHDGDHDHDHPRGILRRFSIRALRSRRGERGAVAVEMALVAPVLVLLTFGVIEFSSAYHDRSIAADAARAGARVGSAKATQSDFATAAVSAVNSAVSTLPSNVPKELWIYKANSSGYPGSSSSFSSCSTDCIRYTYSTGSRSFVSSGGGGWAAASQQVCTQPYDEIGVYVKLDHQFVTKFFGASVTLSDHAVFRFEPVASSACGF